MPYVIVILAALLALIAPLAGSVCHALTLQEARAAAQERYPLVRDYNLIELTRTFTLETASKAWLPQVSLGAQGSWQSAVVAYPEELTQILEQRGLQIKGMGHLQWKVAAEVHQAIWDGGRVSATREVARCEAAEQTRTTAVELYAVQERVDELYFSILLLESQALSLQASVELLEASTARVKALVRNGAAMQCDADALEAEMLTARQQLTSVNCSAAAFREVLGLYVGEAASEKLTTPEALPAPLSNDSSLRPEAQLLTARQATLQAQLRQLDASVRPRIGAFAQGFYGYPGQNFMEAMMSRKPRAGALLGLSLSWDIGSLYTRTPQRRLLLTADERLEVARSVLSFNIDVQASRERSEMQRLQQLAASDEEILQLRRRVRTASEARLREGIVMPLDLLKSITDEKNAAIAVATHHIEYVRATYRLRHTLHP